MSSPSSDAWVLSGGTWKKKSAIPKGSAGKEAKKEVKKTTEPSPLKETPLKKKTVSQRIDIPAASTSTTADSTPETVALTPEKDDVESYSIPAAHIECIQEAYGVECDVYRDVLKVGRRANDRQIRIAYFRRGRQVLAQQDSEHTTKRTSASIADLSVSAKHRFQAVSMAYEILSTPKWKDDYDRCGWILKEESTQQTTPKQPQDEDPEDALSITSSGSTPILRRRNENNKGPRSRSRSLGRGIRWSDEVEELVFKEDPNERFFKAQTLQAQQDIIESFKKGNEDYDNIKDNLPARASSKKTSKKKVILEAQELKQHLESLDKKSLKKSFVSVFLDDLEASLDGLEASIDGLAKYTWSNKGKKKKGKKKQATAAAVVDEVVGVDVEDDSATNSTTTQGALSDAAQIVPVEEMSVSSVSETKKAFEPRQLVDDLNKAAQTSDQQASSNKSKGQNADSDDDDSAQQLFESLTKPAPKDSKTAKQVEMDNGGGGADDDSLNQLFADLTKPAPADAGTTESTKSNKERTSPDLASSRSATESPVPSASPSAMNVTAVKQDLPTSPHSKTVMEIKPEKTENLEGWFAFDPFADESEGGTFEDKGFEAKTFDEMAARFEPTNMVVETKRRRQRSDGDTVSTISKSTAFPKDRSSANKGPTEPELPEEAICILNASDDAVNGDDAPKQVVHVERPQSSQSGVSSLTGLSASTDNVVGKEAAFWCVSKQGEDTTGPIDMLPRSAKAGPVNESKDEAREPNEEAKGEDNDDDSTENLLAPENSDQDFITYLVSYLEALAGDLNKFGVQIGDELRKLTCTNRGVLIDSIVVQEDDMQGMLDVLHTELERPRPEFSTVTTDVSAVTKSYTF